MFSFTVYLQGLGVIVIAAVCTWLLSLWIRNVSIVDSLWSLMFVSAACTYASGGSTPAGPRRVLVLTLLIVWALRLTI